MDDLCFLETGDSCVAVEFLSPLCFKSLSPEVERLRLRVCSVSGTGLDDESAVDLGGSSASAMASSGIVTGTSLKISLAGS